MVSAGGGATSHIGEISRIPQKLPQASLRILPKNSRRNRFGCQTFRVAVRAKAPCSTSLTWTLTGDYEPTADWLLYLTQARGVKSGGFNIGFGPAPLADREFDDETADNFEAGLKWTSPDHRARVRMAAFHTRYTDFQNAGFVGLQFLVNNADKVTTSGLELDGEFLLSGGLELRVGGAYTDAKYKKYEYGSCYPGRPADNATATGCILSGERLPFVSRWRATSSLNYDRPIGFGTVYARLDFSWSSRAMTNTNLDPRHQQDAYGLLNLRAGAKFLRGLDASIWVRNAFDTTYVVQSGVSNVFGNDPAYQTFLGTPREIGLTLRQDF